MLGLILTFTNNKGPFSLKLNPVGCCWPGKGFKIMSMVDFIKINRREIDAVIVGATKLTAVRINNDERRNWILNDEGLYTWARSEGVRI